MTATFGRREFGRGELSTEGIEDTDAHVACVTLAAEPVARRIGLGDDPPAMQALAILGLEHQPA
jgi:hypothetical protein